MCIGVDLCFFMIKGKINIYKYTTIMGKHCINTLKFLMEVIVNILKKLSFGCVLSALCLSVQATAYNGDDCCYANACCNTCCDGPLRANSFGVAIKGGITPTWFADRGHILFVNPAVSPFVFEGPQEPEFDKLFDLPWQVGAELQWNACCNVQFFLEYAHYNASGKKHRFDLDDHRKGKSHNENDNGLTFLRNRNKDFSFNGFYLGARYYFGNVWCSECGTSSLAPFVGFKGGAVWHDKTRCRTHMHQHGRDCDCHNHDSFKQQTLISAGVQFGLDWSFNCNWGVVLTVEAVGIQGLRNNRDIRVPQFGSATSPNAITNLNRGETGHLVLVPVTLGVRYSF